MARTATYGSILALLNAQMASAAGAIEDGRYQVTVNGKEGSKDTISAWNVCGVTDAYLNDRDSIAYSQKLHFKKNGDGFNIIAEDYRTVCSKKYLTVSRGCGNTKVTWAKADDDSGRQIWHVKKNGDGYNLTIKDGRDCDRNMLSTKGDWNKLELVEEDEGKGFQRFSFHEPTQFADLSLPHEASIYSLGMGDDLRDELALSSQCNCDQVLMTTPDNFTLYTKLNLRPIEGENSVFNIYQSDRKCSRKYISVKEDCDVNLVDLWNKDDESGRQRFRAHHVRGDIYTLEAGGRPGCKSKWVSTESKDGTLVLSTPKENEPKQLFKIVPHDAHNPPVIELPSECTFRPVFGAGVGVGTNPTKCSDEP
jgi:hypothetical protein